MVEMWYVYITFFTRWSIQLRFQITYNQITVKYDSILIIDDLNYNMLNAGRNTHFLIFTKDALPTLNDVNILNKPENWKNVTCVTKFNCGLDDLNNITSVQIKGQVPKIKTWIDHEIIIEHPDPDTSYENYKKIFSKSGH